MNNQRDLLPWILGGLSVAAVAAVITVASAGKTVSSLRPAGAATAQATSAPESVSLPAPAAEAAMPAVAAVPAVMETAPPPPAQAQAAAEPALQTGQIWQCMTNGVKTFSNNPCGEKSTLLEVRAINTMNPTPVRYARANGPEPRYSPGSGQNDYSDQQVDSEQGPAETGPNSYAVVQGIAFLPRKRPEHPHRPPTQHNTGPPPRRN
jgi:hypothetical protein